MAPPLLTESSEFESNNHQTRGSYCQHTPVLLWLYAAISNVHVERSQGLVMQSWGELVGGSVEWNQPLGLYNACMEVVFAPHGDTDPITNSTEY